jgi:hypothetical protein
LSKADNEWVDQDPKTRKDTQWVESGSSATSTSAGQISQHPTAGRTLPSAGLPRSAQRALSALTQNALAATLSPSERKQRPLFSGLLKYFPNALMEVAYCSWVGNEQHHPGEPLHWDKSKSTDEHDALMRHLKDAGTLDSDGVRHSAKVAWRALAALEREIANEAKSV